MSFLSGLGALGGGLTQGFEAGSDIAYKRKARQREDTEYQDQRAGQSALMQALLGGGQAPMGPQMQPGQPSQPMELPGGRLAALQKAVYGQESGYGANPQTSPKGAMGGMQIMPATFQQFAQPGESITDPAANKAVGNRILETYTQKYGDPQRALVAYFSGPGNVAPPGSPTPWKEDKSDGRVRVSEYVQQTLGRMGGGQPQQGGPQPQQGGGGDWRSFAQRIIQSNPGITPGAFMHALQAASPFMSMDSKRELQMLGLDLREKGLESRERMYGAGIQERGREADQRAETQTHIAQMKIDQARDNLAEKRDMFLAREERLQKAHDDIMAQRKSATGEKAREFDIRLDMLEKQRQMLHEEKADALSAAQKRLETAEQGRSERLQTTEAGKTERLATSEGGKFARQEVSELGKGDRLQTTEAGKLGRQQITEHGRDERQQTGLAAAFERQSRGIEAAGSRQDKSLTAAGARQERGIEAAGSRQDKSLTAAGTRQERGIEAAGSRQERGIAAASERQQTAIAAVNDRFAKRFQQAEQKIANAKTKDEAAKVLADLRQAEMDRRAAAANAVKAAAAAMDLEELKKLEAQSLQDKRESEQRIDDLTRKAQGIGSASQAAPVGKPLDDTVKQQMQEAMSKGKTREEVIAKAKELGYDVSGF